MIFKFGTSGIRVAYGQILDPNFFPALIEAVLQFCPADRILVGGDGRLGNEAFLKVLKKKLKSDQELWVAQDLILPTPIASLWGKEHEIPLSLVLSASHNRGGEQGDWGLKLHTMGKQLPEQLLHNISKAAQSLYNHLSSQGSYPDPDVDCMSQAKLLMINPDDLALAYYQSLFDFDCMSNYWQDREIVFDALNGAAGPLVHALVSRLGLKRVRILQSQPKTDFAGLAPDPEYSYQTQAADLSCTFDADMDRCRLESQGIWIQPSDNLALVTSLWEQVMEEPLIGVARSFVTSSAVDQVAKNKAIDLYITNVGWKNFLPLMEQQKITLCGEESFGLGHASIFEKDGLFAALFAMQAMAKTGKSYADLLQGMYKDFGQVHFMRKDRSGINDQERQEILKSFAQQGLASFAPELFYCQDGHTKTSYRFSGTATGGHVLKTYTESTLPATL